MTGEARAILAGLRRQGVVVDLDHDRVTVDAPVGVVRDEIRGDLRRMKPALLETLRNERRLLDFSIREFEQSDSAIEIQVPWFEEAVWFVPRPEHVGALVNRGIGRGRIWTAGELAVLGTISDGNSNDIRRIARLKAVFGAEIVPVSREDEPFEGCRE